MRVGGEARFFCCVENENDLIDIFQFIKKKKLPFFILGGGSNVIFSDDTFNGVVIKMEVGGTEYIVEGEKVFVSAGAGVVWDTFVEETIGRGLFGLENLSFIPGTVGASPVQNIGAFGVEVKDHIESVIAFNTETQKFEVFSREMCVFGYRNSFFKTHAGRKYIVTRVTFVLSKKGSFNFSYEGLRQSLKEDGIIFPTFQDVRRIIIALRRKKLPDVESLGSTGSFFKNPIVLKTKYEVLLKRFPKMPHYLVKEGEVKIPAGWLIDNVCGLRGKKQGHVGTYEHQALVIVNYGSASAKDIKNFAKKIIECVKDKTGIVLEEEVRYADEQNA